MPVSVLIPPDNRLFGSSLSDLTLYGGMPTTDFAIGKVPDGDTTTDAAAPVAAGPDAPAAGPTAPNCEGEVAAQETTALLDRTGDQSPMPSSAPLLTPIDPGDGTMATAQPATPQAVGSGGILSTPVATPLQVATGEQTPADAADPLAGPLAGSAAAALAQVVDALPLAQAVDPIGTVDTLIGSLGSTDFVAPVAGDTASLATGALDATPLSSFGGSDPAAGVQTLVGMVESEDLFDLGQSVAPMLGEQPGSGSILDSLAADEAASSLLGDDGGVDQALDDHGIHVGL